MVMDMRNTLVCYNNGLVGVHDNFQRIGENLYFNTIHRNSVNFIAAIGSKNNRFMRSGRQPCFTCRNRSIPTIHLCCQVIGRLDLLRFRHIRGNDIVVLSNSDSQLCRGKQEVSCLELGVGQTICHLDAFPIETAGISCKADILINSKDIFSFTARLFNNAFHAFRHIICYSICHGIVCTGFISLDGFRSIYDQCAVVLRGLNDGYSMAVSRHIRKRDVYISCVRLLSFINLHFRSIENLSGFIHRQGQHINRQIVQCQAAYRQFSCAITLNPEGRQRIIPAHAL